MIYGADIARHRVADTLLWLVGSYSDHSVDDQIGAADWPQASSLFEHFDDDNLADPWQYPVSVGLESGTTPYCGELADSSRARAKSHL